MGLGLWTKRLKRFFADRRGNVALIFGLSLPVMVLMTVGGVDIHRATTVRVNLQDALDASALAAARSPYTDAADIQRVGMDALRANLSNYPNIILREDRTTFILDEDQVVVADARVDVKTMVANIFLPPYGQFMDDYLPVAAHSQVNRSSKNLEVSLVLDLTGSMAEGTRIRDLKLAAKDLVTMIVQDLQTPYYSKVAIVPYSMGVNMGSWAAATRGTPTGSVNISGAEWSTGSAKSLTDITRASPGVITANSHGFVTGDYVWIDQVVGMTQINNRAYRVVRIDANRLSLEYWTGSAWTTLRTRSSDGFSTYSRNGRLRKCLEWDCSVIITTATNHGLSTDDTVYIDNVRGMTQINSTGYQVRRISNTRYALGAGGGSDDYTSGGRSWCGNYGCQWRVFRNMSGNLRWFEVSSCVAERTGGQAYTDAVTNASARAQFNYSGTSSNACPSSPIIPLSSNREGLKSAIDDFSVAGSTAGQIGAAWGWYTVSPNFNSLWPDSAAAPYGDPNTLKAVILMTDGEFNTPYCSGVIARDAGSGSGSNSDKINCNATNGDPFDQSLALCRAMKAQGVIVYTVGFQVPRGGGAERVIQQCASSSSHVYLPASGADLTEAFKAIGRDITRLRISR